MASEQTLPRVILGKTVNGEYVRLSTFWGPRAMEQAQGLMNDGVEYDLDVSDDRCEDCGDIFSTEAREWDDAQNKWVCPSCGGDPRDDENGPDPEN
jgi:rubredoxin